MAFSSQIVSNWLLEMYDIFLFLVECFSVLHIREIKISGLHI